MPPVTDPPAPPGPPRPPARLHARAVGAGPRLVAAHGFTQTLDTWGPVVDDLARDHEVVLVDLPGHGGSSGVAADLVAGAELLVDVGGRATYLGYSMGARFCLHAALARPDAVEALVLVSGTAGIEDPAERESRRAADESLADELDPPGGPGTPAEDQARVDAFLDRWLALPLFAGIPDDATGLGLRRRNRGAGLASSLRLAGTGTQEPLWDRLPGLAMPVLVVTGADDEKFTALGRRMAGAVGANATHAIVPGAGHAPHLQQPAAVAALVRGLAGRRGG